MFKLRRDVFGDVWLFASRGLLFQLALIQCYACTRPPRIIKTRLTNLGSRPRCYASEAKPNIQVTSGYLEWHSQATDRTNNPIAPDSVNNVGLAYHALSSAAQAT
jgi:hypothetical protein